MVSNSCCSLADLAVGQEHDLTQKVLVGVRALSASARPSWAGTISVPAGAPPRADTKALARVDMRGNRPARLSGKQHLHGVVEAE